MSEVVVRPARPEDAPRLAEIHVVGWQQAYAGLLPSEYLDALTPQDRLPRWQEYLADPGSDPSAGTAVLVAEIDGETVGFAMFGPDRDGLIGAGELFSLYVDPPRWGTGAGYALSHAIDARLDAAGIEIVRLWVLEGNARAVAAYERYGYVATGTRRHDPEFDVHDLEYRKSLRRS